MKNKSLLLLLLILLQYFTYAQNREHAFDINSKLGRGINFGNIFEGDPSWGLGWEDNWNDNYPYMVSQLGFEHVRIPIRWEPSSRSSASSPYTINSEFLEKIKGVVDACLYDGLMVIIDMHHHESLLADPEGQKERFLAQWKQLSQAFSSYSDDLLFEIINEPNNGLVGGTLNSFLSDALDVIREDNPNRVVLITSEWGTVGTLSRLTVPNDDNIILTQHCYEPMEFTHQGADWVSNSEDWIGTKWNGTEAERSALINYLQPIVTFANTNNIPVHIGEFGAYNIADDNSRENWTTFMARYYESLGWSWAYWEFSGGYGIYDRATSKYRDFLVDALLNNPMPDPTSVNTKTIYSSDFSNGTDGWEINARQNAGAAATINNADEQLVCNITSKGIVEGDIKLYKEGFKLQSGKQYMVTFRAKASESRNVVAYAGPINESWVFYGEKQTLGITDAMTSYSFSFTLGEDESNNNAAIQFDLGQSDADIYITNFVLAEILSEETSVNQMKQFNTSVYPNPANDILYLNNLDDFECVEIMNINGQIVKRVEMHSALNEINIDDLNSGLYFLKLYNQEGQYLIKTLKE